MKKIIATLSTVCFLSGCSGFLPQSGPMNHQVYSSAVDVKSESIEPFISIVELNPKIVSLFESNFKLSTLEFKVDKYSPCLGIGDTVEVMCVNKPQRSNFLNRKQVVTENSRIRRTIN